MIVDVVQFIRPHGARNFTTTELSDTLAGKLAEMKRAGCRFTTEVLPNGNVSICIEEPELGDFDCEITPNGPEVQQAMEKMLTRFDVATFDDWASRQQ